MSNVQQCVPFNNGLKISRDISQITRADARVEMSLTVFEVLSICFLKFSRTLKDLGCFIKKKEPWRTIKFQMVFEGGCSV